MDISAAWPSVSIQLGLTDGPLVPLASVLWTEIGNLTVTKWSTKRGRQHQLGRFEPGTATITVDDPDRQFDPTYNPLLRPMARVRIRATWSGTTYNIFVGYVTVWPKQWMYQRSSEVQISCVDALGFMNLLTVWSSPWEQVVRPDDPTMWLRLDESQAQSGATVARDSSGNNHDGTYQGSPAPSFNQDSLVAGDSDRSVFFFHALDQRVLVPDVNLISGYPFTFECWVRTTQDRTKIKRLLAAYDADISVSQSVTAYIANTVSHPGEVWFGVLGANAQARFQVSNIVVDDDRPHHIVCVALSDTNFQVWVDGVNSSTAPVASNPSFPNRISTGWSFGNAPASGYFDEGIEGWLDEAIVYDGVALSSTRIAAHYTAGHTGWAGDTGVARFSRVLDEIGWPVADRAIDTGQTTFPAILSAGSALAYFQALAESEDGAFFAGEEGKLWFHERHKILKSPYTTVFVTFGEDTGSGQVMYDPPANWGRDHTDIWNEAQVTRQGGVTQVARNDASIDTFGRRVLTKTVLHESDGQARDHAQWLVDHFKDSIVRIKQVAVKPAEDPANAWPKVLGRELRDRAAFVANVHTPTGVGSAFSQEAHIEGIAHDVDVTAGEWTMTFDLSAADTKVYWLLGTAALGTDTRLGY